MHILSPASRVVLWGAVLLLGLVATPARAQLGTTNNPPPQNLFRFQDSPAVRSDGLGTMAERRQALARKRHAPPRPAR